MTSQQIRTLLLPPRVEEASQKAATLINSQFNNFDSLDQLELLVLRVQQQDEMLQSKLSSSQIKIDALLAETRMSAAAHLYSAQDLSLSRHSLVDELSELSKELISAMDNGEGKSTLLEDIETLHRNLKELQSVKGYLQVLEHALKLSESSVKQIHDSKLSISNTSLSEYQALQAFVTNCSEAFSTLEDGGEQQIPNLVLFLERIREKTWADMHGILSNSLQAAAEKVGWPMPINYLSVSVNNRNMFESAFRNLLKLQKIGQRIQIPTLSGLYPVQALIQPISLRFKYHFEGNRQTNRLDKPEWYFTHILNIAHEHRPFMESVIQPLISSEYSGIDAWCEFTALLLPLLSRKLRQTIPSLLPHPPLLAHTIYQALIFDAALIAEGFMIQGTSGNMQGTHDKWEGVTGVILGKAEWFETWLHGEQKFAEDQYNSAINTTDAWLISDDERNGDNMRSTNSARKVRALFEQVTDRYSPLPQFYHRFRFLLFVQLPLLDHYHQRIASSLDAFETFSSAFARAVPGALSGNLSGREEDGVHFDTKGLTSGIEGVQRLCKALLSAKCIQASMQIWGEELFFVELWTEINQNLTSHGIFNTLLPNLKTEEGNPDDTLFASLATRYEDLIIRTEAMIVQQVCGEIESALKAHLLTTVSSNPEPGQVNDIAFSQSLLKPIALMSSHITFLRTTLPQKTLTKLYRQIASRLAEHILQREILYRGRFDLREGKKIRAECELWVETCYAALGGVLGGTRARIETPWAKLLQAASFASADGDTWMAILEATFGEQGNDDWSHMIAQIVGAVELGKEEVARILRRREDCDR